MPLLRVFAIVAVLLLPVDVSAQDAEQEIRDQISTFSKAVNAGDATQIGELYTEDALVLPPGAEPVRGRESIRQFWQEAVDAGLKNLSLTPVEIVVHDDAAYEMGDFAYDAPAAGGGTRTAGKYIVIWQRGDNGIWRLHRDIWNMNAS